MLNGFLCTKKTRAVYSGKEHNMGCGCGGKKSAPIDYSLEREYLTLDKRLFEYGKEAYGTALFKKFPITQLWIFTFYCAAEMEKCEDCVTKLSKMAEWINKYGFLEDLIKNVKWVIDDEPGNNLILQDLHIEKMPVHIITNGEGKIIDLLYGFPDPGWLEKYILPLVR